MTLTPTPTSTPGPVVTLESVRAVLAADPSATSAARVRAVLGRGSYETIQRCLDAIRAETATAAVPETVTDTPPVPVALLQAAQAQVQQAWAHAHAQAQAATAQHTLRITAERDAALARSAALVEDVESLSTQCDELGAETGAALAQAEQAQAQAQEWERERERTAAAAALAKAEAAAAQGALQAELERLVHMLADLRAGLLQRPAA